MVELIRKYMAKTFSGAAKFIKHYGADGVISRSELNNYTGSNWEAILSKAANKGVRLGNKADAYVNDQLNLAPAPGTAAPTPAPAPTYTSSLFNLTQAEPFQGPIQTPAPAPTPAPTPRPAPAPTPAPTPAPAPAPTYTSSLFNLTQAEPFQGPIQTSAPVPAPTYTSSLFNSTQAEPFQGPIQTPTPAPAPTYTSSLFNLTQAEPFQGPLQTPAPTPISGDEYTTDELLNLIGGSANNTGYFGRYSGDYEVGPIASDTLYGYSSNYQPSSDTGSQSSTSLGPNTGSGDMVKGTAMTYDLTDPADIALMQEYDADLYRNLVSQGQITGANIGDLPPLEEEEEEAYIPPTGGVDLTGGTYQPGSGSGGTGPGGSVDSGGSDSGGSGGSPGGQGGGDVTDVETPSKPYVPTDADRLYSNEQGRIMDENLGGFNPIAYLAAYSDISDLADELVQEGVDPTSSEMGYLAAINDRQGSNFSDFSQMDPTDAYAQVARRHADAFGFDEGRLDKEGTAYGQKLAEFNTGSLDNFITELRSGKLKASTSAAT